MQDILNIDDAVLLTNGYVGIIKYIANEPAKFGIELSQNCPNGHDGKQHFECSPECGIFAEKNEIVTKLDIDTKNNGKLTRFSLTIKDDIIYFPTMSELKEFNIEQSILLTFGYGRDIAEYIPTDIIRLCVQYNSIIKIGDTIQLKKDGQRCNVWCIAISEITKKIYFGVKLLTTSPRNGWKNFIPSQNISRIFVYDSEIKEGRSVKLRNNKIGRIKYIGSFNNDIDEIIGIELDSWSPQNGHDGKGYFQCGIKGRGYFINRRDIEPSNEEILKLAVEGCYSDNKDIQFECTQRMRKLLSGNQPPIKAVIDSGVVSRLIEFLEFDKFDRLQFEASWALTNIASGTSEQTAVVIRYGAIPKFVKLLKSTSEEVQEQAIWALGNIAGDSPECRNLVLSYDPLIYLLPLCRNLNISDSSMCTEQQLRILRNASWALSNFARGKPSTDWKYTQLILDTLSIMIKSDDQEILQDICWAFSYLSDIDGLNQTEEPRIDTMINNGSLTHLVKLLDNESPHVRHPALRSIGNIVAGPDNQTQFVINCGVLRYLYELLKSDRSPIKREACWTISNITAGSKQQIQSVIDANLINPLINTIQTEKYEVAKEALWAISNATSGGNQQQIECIVNCGAIPVLCEWIISHSSNLKLLLIALESIENILSGNDNLFVHYIEECGGIQYLRGLKSNQSISDEIYDKVTSIIDTYFDVKPKKKEEETKQAPVPKTYTCFKCKAVGKHWIMQCNK